MTHDEIERALDQPGFALDSLPPAERRLLVDTVHALVAKAAEPKPYKSPIAQFHAAQLPKRKPHD